METTEQFKLRLLKTRMLPNISDTEECIEYPVLNVHGYGEAQFNDKTINRKIHVSIHRLSYEHFNNDSLTTNDVIMHTCDNPKCYNPKHLKKGTHADNVADKVAKGRQAKGSLNGRYVHGKHSKYKEL